MKRKKNWTGDLFTICFVPTNNSRDRQEIATIRSSTKIKNNSLSIKGNQNAKLKSTNTQSLVYTKEFIQMYLNTKQNDVSTAGEHNSQLNALAIIDGLQAMVTVWGHVG